MIDMWADKVNIYCLSASGHIEFINRKKRQSMSIIKSIGLFNSAFTYEIPYVEGYHDAIAINYHSNY